MRKTLNARPGRKGIKRHKLGGAGWIPDEEDLKYIKHIAMTAYTKVRIRRQLGVPQSTFSLWLKTYPEIEDAIQEGRDQSILHVEDALISLATSNIHSKITLDACVYFLNTRGKWTRYQKQIDEKYDIRKALKMKDEGLEDSDKKDVSVTLKLMREGNSPDIRKDISNGVETPT